VLRPSAIEGGGRVRNEPILEVANLTTIFDIKRSGKKFKLHAVNDVSFDLMRGEILGFVGETGCGKTTVGRSLIGLVKPASGTVKLDGEDVSSLGEAVVRKKMRLVFQDPYASLNPRRSIGNSVAEAGDIHRVFKGPEDRREKVAEAMKLVGLNPSFAERFPHELSGGQRQRVGIARSILPNPEIIIADEPVSALDVSIQAQVLNLMMDLRDELHLTIMFISHDLSVVGQISDRVAVMYLGTIVEIGGAREVLADPKHPYTRALVSAVPRPDPRIKIQGGLAKGEIPSRLNVAVGCSFAERCPLAQDICRKTPPESRLLQGGRKVACHFVE
jgi:oligopeptide/dipeptide ABC transporter ATP-binding protein